MKHAIGDRMKENYELRYKIKLTRRTPVILRLDGRTFHTLTRRCEKPFDNSFQRAMEATAHHLCREIQGAKIAYTQSDEISVLLIDYDRFSTEAWFDYNLQKMVSVAASMASVRFNSQWESNNACFDCRAFNIPREDVANYFVWRQQDWCRNSVQGLAQAHFSHRQLHGMNQANLHEILHGKGVNWADLDPVWKNGTFLFRAPGNQGEGDPACKSWKVSHLLQFKQNRGIIEYWVEADKHGDESGGG